MSDSAPQILTPEELEDLLESQVSGAGDGADDQRLARRLPRATRAEPEPDADAGRDLRRAVEDCATQWGRRMASSYQRRIECSLIGWDEFDTADAAVAVLHSDEVVCFSLASETGFVLLGRPLFSALLGLEFGAGGATKPAVGPPRPYTGIEQRLLTRLVRDLLTVLETSWRAWCPLRPEVTGVVARKGLVEAVSSRVMLASLDVTALDTVGRVRIAIPTAAFAVGSPVPQVASDRSVLPLQKGVGDVPVTLRAEVGSAELTLSQLAALQVGDVISIRPSASEGLLICLEGRPKFRAVAGRVGSRLAAQAVARV